MLGESGFLLRQLDLRARQLPSRSASAAPVRAISRSRSAIRRFLSAIRTSFSLRRASRSASNSFRAASSRLAKLSRSAATWLAKPSCTAASWLAKLSRSAATWLAKLLRSAATWLAKLLRSAATWLAKPSGTAASCLTNSSRAAANWAASPSCKAVSWLARSSRSCLASDCKRRVLLFRFKQCLPKDRRSVFKAGAGVVQFAPGSAVRRIFSKLNHSGVGVADQIADRGMHSQIFFAGALVFEVRRYEFVNFCKGAVGPTRPGQVKLLAKLFEGAAAIGEKVIPVEHRPAHLARFGLGVQHMAQPDETTVAQRNAVTAIERQGDFKRRSQQQHRSDGPFGFVKHRRPERQEPAHPRVLDDRKAGVAEFAAKGLTSRVREERLQRLRQFAWDRICANRCQLLPPGGQNLVIQAPQGQRIPKSPSGCLLAGAIKLRGAAPPSRISAPATLDVPLRCMPRTRTAVLVELSTFSSFERSAATFKRARSPSKFKICRSASKFIEMSPAFSRTRALPFRLPFFMRLPSGLFADGRFYGKPCERKAGAEDGQSYEEDESVHQRTQPPT